jgi:integrase
MTPRYFCRGIRHIELHAAGHTCAMLTHLQGVPVAVIAAWDGHKPRDTHAG